MYQGDLGWTTNSNFRSDNNQGSTDQRLGRDVLTVTSCCIYKYLDIIDLSSDVWAEVNRKYQVGKPESQLESRNLSWKAQLKLAWNHRSWIGTLKSLASPKYFDSWKNFPTLTITFELDMKVSNFSMFPTTFSH